MCPSGPGVEAAVAAPLDRRYRLIALDPEAIANDADLLPVIERLLRHGVIVVVRGDAIPEPIGRAARGPYREHVVLDRDVAAAAERRGVAAADVLIVSTRSSAERYGRVVKSPLHPTLVAQARLHPVELPAQRASDPTWQLIERGFVVTREHELESIFALGNGYLGTRASLAEGSPLSSPATLVAGVYVRPRGRVPELMNLPDWTSIAGTLDGAPLRLELGEILAHARILDMRDGILWREWRHAGPRGRVSVVHGLRLASQADRHLLLQSITLTPESHGGRLRVEAALEGPRVIEAQGGLKVALAFASALETPERLDWFAGARGPEVIELDVRPGETYRLDRVVSVWTSRESEAPERDAARHLERALLSLGPEGLVRAHRDAWHSLWRDVDVTIEGDPEARTALRFAIYHLCSSVHPEDEAVSIGARGLSGGAYKGHVFWDTEIFMLPFFTLTRPGAARSILTYRHRTLDAARARASERGYRGALYAWESADTGDDVTPPFVLAPDGELLPVHAGEQEQHISADVAYGAWSYWHATHDERFLLEAGAEIVIETARFWASRVERGDDDRYHIRCVVGPDEYHSSVDDNAYTNVMAQWNLERAAEVVALCARRWPDAWRALSERLSFDADEPELWLRIASGMYTGFDEATGLFEQFRGYFDLEEIDLAAHEPRQAPIDLLLGTERIQRSRVIKQPDVVMLLHLLWDRFSPRVREANFRFYEPRTAHGSSLSPPIHAAVAARLGDTELAMRYFTQTAEIDLANNMGNSAGGVHLAAQGGLWQAVVLGFAGLRLEGEPSLEPHLPSGWEHLAFRVRWRGRALRCEVSPGRAEVRS